MNSSAKSEQHDIRPVSILFVCLGNICRSPAADGIMHKLVKDAGLDRIITIDSAGTYGGHAGALPDARMRQHAIRRGYDLTHHSRKVTEQDFDRFDLILAMDDYNYQDLFELAPDREAQQKIYRITDFSVDQHDDHVPDPYYEGEAGFEHVLNILEDACNGLLNALKQGKP
jgi:protein-tyrosine phosphatase